MAIVGKTFGRLWSEILMDGVSRRTRLKYYSLFAFCCLFFIIFMHAQLNTPLETREFTIHLAFLSVCTFLTIASVETGGWLLFRRSHWPVRVKPVGLWLVLFPYIAITSFLFGVLELHAFEAAKIIAEKHEQHGYHPHQFANHLLFIVVLTAIIHAVMHNERPIITNNVVPIRGEPGAAQNLIQPGSPGHSPTIYEAAPPGFHRDPSLNMLNLRHDGQDSAVDIGNIAYVQVEENYCHIWLFRPQQDSPRITVRSTLSRISEELPEDQFVQPHRSYLVNRAGIETVRTRGKNSYIVMKNGVSVPISKRRVQMISNLVSGEPVYQVSLAAGES